jgi:hypothetical protein
MAPGPGRLAEPSIAPLFVAGMQNVEASVALFGVPADKAPAATPFSVIVRHVVLPKQPMAPVDWPVQNTPTPDAVAVRVPVMAGARLTGIVPMKVAAFGGQSRVRPSGFVLMQSIPDRAPLLHLPLPGLPGLPPAEHFGQRAVPVR